MKLKPLNATIGWIWPKQITTAVLTFRIWSHQLHFTLRPSDSVRVLRRRLCRAARRGIMPLGCPGPGRHRYGASLTGWASKSGRWQAQAWNWGTILTWTSSWALAGLSELERDLNHHHDGGRWRGTAHRRNPRARGFGRVNSGTWFEAAQYRANQLVAAAGVRETKCAVAGLVWASDASFGGKNTSWHGVYGAYKARNLSECM